MSLLLLLVGASGAPALPPQAGSAIGPAVHHKAVEGSPTGGERAIGSPSRGKHAVGGANPDEQ